MIRRCVSQMFIATLFIATAITTLSSAPVKAQGLSSTSKATASANTAAPLKTPDGVPDLQGIWTNSTVIPLERPANLKGKEFYTKEEAAENAKRVLGNLELGAPRIASRGALQHVPVWAGSEPGKGRDEPADVHDRRTGREDSPTYSGSPEEARRRGGPESRTPVR